MLYFNKILGRTLSSASILHTAFHKSLQYDWCNQGCNLDDDVPSILFLWASFVCVYCLLIRMKIPSLAFGSKCDKVIYKWRCKQVYSGLLLTVTHSSVHASTSVSCLLLPVVLVVLIPAHRGLVHGAGSRLSRQSSCSLSLVLGVPDCHCGLVHAFKAVTVALFTGFQLVTFVFLLAGARFLYYIIRAFVVLLFDSFILVTRISCLGSKMVNLTPF